MNYIPCNNVMLFIPVQVIIRHVIRKKHCEDILYFAFLSVAAFSFSPSIACV